LQFDWTTFVLEVINFLVLVWILQRFLYRPVREAVERRRQAIAQTLADARAVEERAKALQQQYEGRLAAFASEKEEARRHMHEEIAAERVRLTEALKTSLAEEREKSRVLAERRAEEQRHALTDEALAEGGRFAARLLSRLSGPELEARILGIVVEDLGALGAETLEAVRGACRQPGASLLVSSAYSLGAEQRELLRCAFERLFGTVPPCAFEEDRTLVAGLRIEIGPWVLRANLQDELSFFGKDAGIAHA
jgi:F-type H+-transporting ATPase subunit b